MKTRTLVVLAISSALFTLGLMIFGSHGSLDPTEVGFYTSIGAGIIWFMAMYFAIKKFWIKP